MDTVGAWLVHKLERDRGARIVGATREQQLLIDHVTAADQPVKLKREYVSPFVRVVGQVGASTQIILSTMVGMLGFFGAMLISVGHIFRHPRRFRLNAVVPQFEVVGIHALFIVGLMCFLVGIVIAQQGAVQLRQFGAEVYTINLVGRSAIKELGVLMTAIMVAGRSGSAFAAQIGSMKLNEEIDAMRTIGVSPMEALVFPRVLATVLMMPLLGFYAAMMAIVGGGIFCWMSLDIPPVTFIQRIREVVPMTDLYQALIKAPVFGMIIAMAGCYQGMQVEGQCRGGRPAHHHRGGPGHLHGRSCSTPSSRSSSPRSAGYDGRARRPHRRGPRASRTASASRSSMTGSISRSGAARFSAWSAARAPASRC